MEEIILNALGQWAVIDIETSGADFLQDQIIDIGFLEFEGCKLVRKYSSLVRYEFPLSQFIQKLTGITDGMLSKAPRWKEVEPDVMELYGAQLLAHNADFEKGFLSPFFEKIEDDSPRESYEDSIPFLAILFPYKSSLKLERFIVDWNIADSEIHRGFEDSLDLLKVLLVANGLSRIDSNKRSMVLDLYRHHDLKDDWYYHFLSLADDELMTIAKEIDFDLQAQIQIAREFEERQKEEAFEVEASNFSMSFSGDNIKKILRDEKSLQKISPHYQFRESQEQLSLRTGQAFKNDVHALIQAPTGTGKTLGYLLPSTLFSLESEKQVLVATGTKALQEQAMFKDIPQLRKMLGLSDEQFKIRRLVGSSNHLCELLYRQDQDSDSSEGLFEQDGEEKKHTALAKVFLEMVFYHNSEASFDDWILRDDLPYVLQRKFKKLYEMQRDFAVDFRSCSGNQCPFAKDCTYIRGLREAKDANLIIGNHSLMFSWPRAFPRPQYIVVDEAHKIEEETTKAFSYELSQSALDHLSKSLNQMQGLGSLFYLLAAFEEEAGASTPVINQIREGALEAQKMLSDHLTGLPDLMEQFFKRHPRYTSTFWNELPMVDKSKPKDTVSLAIFNHLDSIKFILENLYNVLLPYATRWEVKDLKDEQQVTAFTRFETFFSNLSDIFEVLDVSLNLKEGYTHSLRFHENEGYLFESSPINVGEKLHDHLLETTSSVVMTSATLGNAHGDQGVRGIEWATGYTYLDPQRRFKSGFYLPSVYDYAQKTRVFLCDDVPSLHHPEFVSTVLKPIMKLIKELGGRTLLLFSARSRFDTAREILLREFEGKIPLFIQGMGSQVIEDFKSVESGILLGMESFGEGIDIPGETLQFVFVDKVPDLRMDRVINERRNFYDTNIGNEFTDYYLSHRTRKLHQKLGRLIRRENDYGGIIVVDSRISKWKGRTMGTFMKLMEPYQIKREPLQKACEDVANFILDH